MQQRVNTIPVGYWPRAEKVELSDGELRCVLDYKSAYCLAESYGDRPPPHLRFLNLKTDDEELTRFVERYGPLSLVLREDGCADPLASVRDYWAFQQYLKTLVILVKAFAGGRLQLESLREALLAFLASGAAHSERIERKAGDFWKLTFQTPASSSGSASEFTLRGGGLLLPDDPTRFINAANESWLLRIAADFVEGSVVAEAGFRVDWKAGRPRINAQWKLDSLRDALAWMCWYDQLRKNLMVFCAECSVAFRPGTAHKRKFCSPECAHRKAARSWAKKNRKRTAKERR